MIRLLWTEIDLDVIAQNMQIIRKMAKSKEVAAVIKLLLLNMVKKVL